MAKEARIVKLVSTVRHLNSGNGVNPKDLRQSIEGEDPPQNSDFNLTLQMAIKGGYLEARGSRLFLPAVGRTSLYDQTLRDSREEVVSLTERVRELTEELEQFRRSKNLLIYGVAERPGDDAVRCLVELARKIGVELTTKEIERAQRVGRKRPGRPRSLLVTFTNYRHRCQVFDEKKRLRKMGVVVVEHLTPERVKLLVAARKQFGPRNAWTTDGTVYCRNGEQVLRVEKMKVKTEPEDTESSSESEEVEEMQDKIEPNERDVCELSDSSLEPKEVAQ